MNQTHYAGNRSKGRYISKVNLNNSNPNTVTDNYDIAKNVITSYVNKEHDKITHKMNNFFFQPSSLKDSGEVQAVNDNISPQPMRRDLKTADGTKKFA